MTAALQAAAVPLTVLAITLTLAALTRRHRRRNR